MKEIHPGQNGLGFPFFILLLNWVVRRIDADLSIAQIFFDNSCPLNFLIMIREDHVFGLLGPVS